ncbi:MAG: hypothetical protein ABL919_05425 [Methylococcales bacterium]
MNLPKTKLAKAVALAITGVVVTAGTVSASASTTMYNRYNESAVPRATDGYNNGAGPGEVYGTDGWVWGGINAISGGDPDAAVPGWVGTSGPYTNAFGSTKAMPINWGAHLTALGDNLEISQVDSFNRFGVYADLDTAGGAWHSTTASEGILGKRNHIDIGLFKSDVTQNVTLTASGINDPAANFGITLYQGLSTSETFYNHHGIYFGDSGLDYEGMIQLDHTPRDPLTGLTTNTLTFNATAGQLYTIILGGNNGQHWNENFDGYKLNISTVPVPGAVWLFGSAILGLLGNGRRQNILPEG